MNHTLLRLSTHGEPINTEQITNGVLILPTQTLPSNHQGPLVTIQFQIKAGSKISNGVLYTNIGGPDEPFEREKYQSFAIGEGFSRDTLISVPIYRPGAYNYYIEYGKERTARFYFNVAPYLRRGSQLGNTKLGTQLGGQSGAQFSNSVGLPFNALNIETVVSKWIGPLSRWDDFFRSIASKGYNMIHFTPLQERGESDSPYSIYDQLRFDPNVFASNEEAEKAVKGLGKHGLLTLTDIVWNHTANNSAWIREHPDAGYNAETAPHLAAAIELDAALLEFSEQMEALGFGRDIESEADVSHIVDHGIVPHVIGRLRLWEYYVLDSAGILAKMGDFADIDVPEVKDVARYVVETCTEGLGLAGSRFGNTLDAGKFSTIIRRVYNTTSLEDIKRHAKKIIDEINAPLYGMYDDDVSSIKQQLFGRIKYLRLEDGGPKLGPVTASAPLTEPYFTRFTVGSQSYALANNGWIWGGNPLVDFASSESRAYLRREVIIWGDCVKLRYGSGPQDSPYLWERMEEYTRMCARVFDGFRIDNCHSTPLHVGEHLLDVARNENPHLYVVAELFSGSAEMDKMYVERLGINSLIREAMQAQNVAELSTLIHKHGGRPIGSFAWLPLDEVPAEKKDISCDSSFSCGLSPSDLPKVLTTQAPHALVMDCTHDNETPSQKRTTEDTLPNAALVAFCSSAIGSVYGYDECYPRLLDVVKEKRIYSQTDNSIGAVKQKLYSIRKQLSEESKDVINDHETYIHHQGQYITVQRHNARTGKGWFLIARTKFAPNYEKEVLEPPRLGGTKVRHEFSYGLAKRGEYKKDEEYLTGVPVEVLELAEPRVEWADGSVIFVDEEAFPPGSISVFSTEIPGCGAELEAFITDGVVESTSLLDLYDLNAVLYRCEGEERDASEGKEGTYNVPGYGPLVYAGLEGWITCLKHVIWSNDLGAPPAAHLRAGVWALDYCVRRLDKYATKGISKFQDWLSARMERVKQSPYFLRPHYFALIIGIAYEACRMRALSLMPPKVQESTNFVHRLAMTSVQMLGRMKKTSLDAFEQVPCVAAGLPHFSSDYMRCWGRDVFISIRGLMVVLGRYDDARAHILGFAATLKHGLIPNLLDAGRNPRYNARDAAWFFVQAVQDYVREVPGGKEILGAKVKRRFPKDDRYITYDDPEAFSYTSTIKEIIQEIFSRHASGIKYREANAGPNLDSQMSDEGFNVEAGIDWGTGLVYGGSQSNCGTWMDKMGESERAGSKGVPGTPRDGSAVELQGLLKSALRWVVELNKQGLYEWTTVKKPNGEEISFIEWNNLLQDNFERCFYVPKDAQDDKHYEIDSSLVNRRGIYKDLFRSGKAYEDYQLRPNFAIAMVVAPELFTKEYAIGAIEIADKVIRGPVGMRTLDPSDYNYRPYYNNGEDSDDFATSKGRNYHQGPEWVWCTGYFLRAYNMFGGGGLNERMEGHVRWIRESPWGGLTELTNRDGELCGDSSPTQAWSGGGLLDLYEDVWRAQ